MPFTADGAPGATRTIVLNRSPGEDASEALRAAEVRFARFFNSTPIAIASVDRAGRVGRTNAPFARLFGSGEGRLFTELVGPADREMMESAVGAAIAGRGDLPSVDATLAADGDRSVR